jgi:hypothetical protein
VQVKHRIGSPKPATRVWLAVGIAVLAAWAAYTWWRCLTELSSLYHPFPAWDYWRVVYYLERYRALDLRVLWIQHNEHRIIFPELFFAADMILFRGRQLFPVVCSAAFYFSSWVLLCYCFANLPIAIPLRASAILLTAVVIGWRGAAVVLADPFLLQWTLLGFCVVTALDELYDSRHSRRSLLHLSASAALGVVATYTSANGICIWPVLVAAALALRISFARICALTVVAAVSVGCYFVGYQAGQLELARIFEHPLHTVLFVGAFVGMPFGAIKGPLFGPITGLVGIGVVLSLAAVAWRRDLFRFQFVFISISSYAFVILTALMIAAGRMKLEESRFTSAEAARYLCVPLLAWTIAILLAIGLAGCTQRRITSSVLVCSIVALLIAVGFPKLRWWLRYEREFYANEQLASLALANGLKNTRIARRIFPDPGFVSANLPNIRDRGLAIFSTGVFNLIGKPISAAGRPPLEGTAVGAITYAAFISGGVEVAGWASKPGWIILAGPSGRILGLGKHLSAGLPYDAPQSLKQHSGVWFGFARTSVNPIYATAYLLSDGCLFPLNSETMIAPAFTDRWK